MLIDGQVALVTGSGSGTGAATGRNLAANGARLAILDFAIDKAAVGAALDAAAAHFCGAPRIVVSCAGIGLAARIVWRENQPSFDVFERPCA